MHITHHGSQNNVTNKLSNIFAPISDQILNIWSNCDMSSRQSAHGTLVIEIDRHHGIQQQRQRLNVGEMTHWHYCSATPQPRLSWAVSISTTLATMECPLCSIPTFLHRLRAWWLSLSRSRYLNFVVILIVFCGTKAIVSSWVRTLCK